MTDNIIRGKVFVVGDNIDTDQIIPAQYLTLVPTIKEEYDKLGSYALCGLPDDYKERFVADGKEKTIYPVIVAGANFGCGSSREHAPIALGAAGAKVVIAQSFARIFFRNSIATGEVFPVESPEKLNDVLKNGDEVEVDLDKNTVKVLSTGKVYQTNDIGAVKDVINAGGIFKFARKSGMIK